MYREACNHFVVECSKASKVKSAAGETGMRGSGRQPDLADKRSRHGPVAIQSRADAQIETVVCHGGC